MTGYEANPEDEGKGADHGCSVNQDVVKEEQEEDGIKDAKTYCEAPEGCLAFYFVQKCVVNEEPGRKTTPGCETKTTELVILH